MTTYFTRYHQRYICWNSSSDWHQHEVVEDDTMTETKTCCEGYSETRNLVITGKELIASEDIPNE